MTLSGNSKRRLADLIMERAQRALRRQRPEWAEAMACESAAILSDDERLRWAASCALVSYRAPGAFDWAFYPGFLCAGVTLMTVYQWRADESLRTLVLLGMIGMTLGVIQPRRFWISGAAIGLVVAAVNAFETLTGLRPAYELYAHTFLHDAWWTVLVAPAMIASGVGGYLGRLLRHTAGAMA
jgi:hypothetical protein